MNKARRHELKMLKYKKRIRKFAATADWYINRNGETIYKPKAVEVIKDLGQLHYRTAATPCSCMMCSHSKYQRHKFKQETLRELAA